MSSPPQVSFITPAHNRPRELRAALASCLCQSIEDWEAVVVDDHSDDADLEAVVAGFSDPRLRYHQLDSDQRGVADAVALSVGDLADAWEHDVASINEPEDEDASFEREALRARALQVAVPVQCKVQVGGGGVAGRHRTGHGRSVARPGCWARCGSVLFRKALSVIMSGRSRLVPFAADVPSRSPAR